MFKPEPWFIGKKNVDVNSIRIDTWTTVHIPPPAEEQTIGIGIYETLVAMDFWKSTK